FAKSFACIAPPVFAFIHAWSGQSGSPFFPHVTAPPSAAVASALALGAGGADADGGADATESALSLADALGSARAAEAGVVVAGVAASSALTGSFLGHAVRPAARPERTTRPRTRRWIERVLGMSGCLYIAYVPLRRKCYASDAMRKSTVELIAAKRDGYAL